MSSWISRSVGKIDLLKPLRELECPVSFARLTFRDLVILFYCTIYLGPSTSGIQTQQI
jgi:hypothetical protein